MKVCIAIHSIDKNDGGPSRSVPILAKGLSELGMEVTVLTMESASMNLDIFENSNIKLKVLLRKGYRKQIKRFIHNGNYDLIHSQNLWTPFYHWVAKISRELKIPYIMTPRGTLEPWCLSQKKIKKIIALKIYQIADLNKASAVLATSEMEAKNIQNIGVKTPIAVIPNGIDITEYPCRTNQDKYKIRKQILFLSRIHKKKGIELLINSWYDLKNKYPDWSVVIVGNGDVEYITELNTIIKNQDLTDSIKIMPPVFGQEKIELYKQSSLFVLPTYSENFGMVIAEAMACGLPVITTSGTPWDKLSQLGLGWYIEPNQKSLTAAIDEALQEGSNELYKKGQKSSIFINDNFHYLGVAEKCSLLYNWITNGGAKPVFVI